jgi:hypothetical protein
MSRICSNCGAHSCAIQCSHCHESWYCSPECQTDHWTHGHSRRCAPKSASTTTATAAIASTTAAVLRVPTQSDANDRKHTPCAPGPPAQECQKLTLDVLQHIMSFADVRTMVRLGSISRGLHHCLQQDWRARYRQKEPRHYAIVHALAAGTSSSSCQLPQVMVLLHEHEEAHLRVKRLEARIESGADNHRDVMAAYNDLDAIVKAIDQFR